MLREKNRDGLKLGISIPRKACYQKRWVEVPSPWNHNDPPKSAQRMPLPAPTEPPAWHHESAENVLAGLDSSTTGLTSVEVALRLAAGGRNVLTEVAPVSRWRIFSRQFKSLVIWILIGAEIVSGVLGDAVDAIAIFAVVALNAVIGFYQEFSAGKSISALKMMTAPQAKVRRDGKVLSLPAVGLVVGDVLVLEAGDLVAADARLIKTASLSCIESALTGESEAVSKDPATLPHEDVRLRPPQHDLHGHQCRQRHGPRRGGGHGDEDRAGPDRGHDATGGR